MSDPRVGAARAMHGENLRNLRKPARARHALIFSWPRIQYYIAPEYFCRAVCMVLGRMYGLGFVPLPWMVGHGATVPRFRGGR